MATPNNAPAPGRATADAAFLALTKSIAERNEVAHRAAREIRVEADAKKAAQRRRLDRL